ncbi:two-component regulator propeller domain-containing protein [Pedobacter sp. SYSU D00535]|uniref:two-component regulator propeller domain-containing protein n=1 Tax=Pedobacter sp. SYSU D00535 TaxID=2810308 RepID=UPI001A95A81B|nr:two-component regulator propeller domain-containing protein [Pedobacter sp. SYSU D00535]
MKELCFLLAFLFGNQFAVLATLPEPKFTHYSTEDGLSHNGVLCIKQDREGFIWLGTWDGINRFDGHTFTTYKSRPGDKSDLRNNKVRDIVEDQLGYLWVMTYDRKVYRFDKKTEEFTALSKSVSGENLEHLYFKKIIPLVNGDTWLLTENREVLCVSPGANNSLRVVNFSSGRYLFAGRAVNFIYEDKDHKIWFGTKKGLVCLIKRGSKYSSYFSSPKVYASNLSVTSVSGNSAGEIYFGSTSGVLIRYHEKGKTFSNFKIQGTEISDVRASNTGKTYVTTKSAGLFLFERGAVFRRLGDGSQKKLQSIFEDSNGNLWIETPNAGVYRYSPTDGKFKYFTSKGQNPYGDKGYNIFEDVNHVVWVRLKNADFGYFNRAEDRLDFFYNEPGASNKLFSNSVVSALSDSKGVLWFSSRNGGLNKVVFPSNNFKHHLLIKDPNAKSDNEVRALFQDQDGKTWITSKTGKLRVYKNGKEIKGLLSAPYPELGRIYCITEGKDGTIWIGTKGQGLLKLDPLNKERTQYKLTRFVRELNNPYGISGDQIYSILVDDKGRVWVGTFGKGLNLLVFENGRYKFRNTNNTFKKYPNKAFNVIRHIIQGPDKRIWLATTDGLLRFDPNQDLDNVSFIKTTKIPGDRSSLGSNDALYIYQARDKNIWIGTFGGGVSKLISSPSDLKQPLRFKTFTREQGLPNDIILSIVEDDIGGLWIATENGLSRLDHRRGIFRNYDNYDGLPKTRFSESAVFRSNTGEIYFGCLNGYISFRPDKLVNQKFKSLLALTNFQLYNTDINTRNSNPGIKYAINYAKEIILRFDQNFIAFEYALLDFRLSKNISYSYILEGYDKTWHHVKNQRKAAYTQIPPGKYTFKVKVTDSYYFSNLPEKEISVHILKPWWLSNWAILGYCLAALVIIEIIRRVALTLIRLKNKVVVEKKMTELKLQLFTNVSHELRTPLTLIVNPLNRIGETENLSSKGREYLEIADKNTKRMLRFINQLLDLRKIQSQQFKLSVQSIELVSFLNQIASYFNDICSEKNIQLKVVCSSNECIVWGDEEKIEIVFFNIISNAIKFTPVGKHVYVEVDAHGEKYVTVSVIDEGVGVSEDKLQDIFKLYYEGDNRQDKAFKGTGIGLALSKDIITLHKGRISASNNKEEGITVAVELLKGNSHYNPYDIVSERTVINQVVESKPIKVQNIEPPGNTDGLPKILIVEDNTELRKLLADQFSSRYQVLEAENGRQGCKKAVEFQPDVILSDVMMPEMDGIQMLNQLKSEMETSHIPIILLTAKSSIEDQINGLSFGADYYVTKPFHTDYIEHLIKNLVTQRQRILSNILEKTKVVKLEPSEIFITPRDEKFLKDVIQIVETKMSDIHFKIDSVAEGIGMGRTTFFKKIKSLTNMSPVELVRDIRLKRAKQLLDTGEMGVTEVGYMVGFNSSSYFSTCFREKYNVAPSEYLKSKQ